MTTISIAPAAASIAATPTRLRLTVRGRRVLAFLAALPAIGALAFALLAGGSALASHEGGAPAGTFETVTVGAGDSLWSIAEEVAPTADPRDVVDSIARLNALDDVAIVPGQVLAIPAEYSSAP